MNLYNYQKEVLASTEKQNKVAYYLDMGLGKTYVGSEKMVQLGTKINLVICQKSKIDDWVNHFVNNYPDYKTYDLTTWKPKNYFVFNSEHWMTCEKRIFVINYDLVWRRQELKNLKDFTLMLDESSLIQHATSKRSKFIIKKLNPMNVILLSGTPTNGKYENLISQINLLGWRISEELFWNQYVNWEWNETDDGFWQKKILGYKNEDRLKRKLRQHGCVFMKTEEVIELPEQIYNTIKIETTKDYKKFRKESYIELKDGTELVGDTILNKMLYERQLCGQYNDAKLEAFSDLLESTSDRLIVFYNFNDELHQLEHICGLQNRVLSRINGQVKDLYAYDNINDSVTLIQYQAGSMGLNLQKANKIIYFTPPLSSEFFEQSKKRIHRVGQNQSCFYYYLVCKNSIEEKIYNTLKMRKDYTDKLFENEI